MDYVMTSTSQPIRGVQHSAMDILVRKKQICYDWETEMHVITRTNIRASLMLLWELAFERVRVAFLRQKSGADKIK
jgi:hypothetical protein